ncbi:MAG TPA: response regulator [Steroidobacteraceae bacterium]|nr:response regulator [Steroidobacteraceae bacterium]
MGHKRALVVDDSKSARVILSRMLEKYDIDVDMAESAEQAIEYLRHDRPDAIFMDHLMPGMDGLQAVQAIKSNPQTAMIPIMMYTSQEGELYVGQARALGAMGVLPKQVRPVDVSKVLYELHLLPDRRDANEPALAPVEIAAGPGGEKTLTTVGPLPSTSQDWGRRIEAQVKQQSVDLRRFVVASLDSLATRLAADLRNTAPSPVPVVPEAPPPRRPSPWPWIFAAGSVCLLAALSTFLWMSTRDDLTKARAALAALQAAQADLKQSSERIADSVKDLSAALAASATSAPAAAALPAVPGLPRSEPVPYGELPFDRSRLEVLRDVLQKLEAQNFRGVLKITNLAGTFCLSGNASDGFAPAPASLPVSKCDLVGNPFEEALSGQQRQSIAFANLVAGERQRTSGAITVAVENPASPRGATAYPARTDSLTAGEWNRTAAANNRVDFAAEPAAL